MKINLKYLDNFFLIFLSLIPLLPEFYVIDIQSNQFFYLSITQSLIFLYLIIYRNPEKIIYKVQNQGSIIFSILFLLICLISLLYANFKVPALIEIFWYSTLFITLFNTCILILLNDNYKIVIYILTSLLFIEVVYLLKIFFQYFSFESGLQRIRELQGLSANQNINAFSICIKIPLLFYFIVKSKTLFKKVLFSIFLFASSFSILIIASRGAILALLIILISFIFLDYFSKIKVSFKKKLLITSTIVFTFFFQNILYNSSNSEFTSSVNRLNNLIDASSNYRIDSYKVALKSFLENPFTGVGIGNWQLYHIKQTSNTIIEYQAPKHVHNDLIQILADIGILGLFFFILIYFFPFKSILKKLPSRKLSLIEIILILSFIIFFIDSNLNFPRVRPYSQVNVIYLLSILIFLNVKENNSQLLHFKKTYFFFFLVLIPIVYSNYKVYSSSRDQLDLMRDFNFHQSDLILTTDIVKNFNDEYPNLNNTNIPLKNLKALYYIQEKKYDDARELIKGARRVHDFWGISDYQTSLILYEEKNIDSSYYYAKKAFEKLPNNRAHITQLQRTLFVKQDIKEMEELFLKTLNIHNEAIWQNYLVSTSELKMIRNLKFSKDEILRAKEGLNSFPNNSSIQRAYRIIVDGVDKIQVANEYDKIANEDFSKGNFIDAIKSWEKSIEILPVETAYYYNISLSYTKLNENQKARETLELLKEIENYVDNGELDYYTALTYLNEDLDKSCAFFIKSAKKGYKNSFENINTLQCSFN